MTAKLGVRWTVGDVSSRGWEALRLSVHCAARLFGGQARLAVCVNTVSLADAQAQTESQTGSLPVEWVPVTREDIPPELAPHLDPEMAEGVGWKLVPPRLFPDLHELSLDNDCLLWGMPAALGEFLGRTNATLLAEDVTRCLGQFDDDPAVLGAVNSGIRGLPPGFDLQAALTPLLGERLLRSELDEQGLQAAALHLSTPCLRVQTDEVTICSPFWPRQPGLGSCGAHFVGLNAKHLPWDYYDEPGDLVRRRHWDEHRPALYRHAGLPLTPALPLEEA